MDLTPCVILDIAQQAPQTMATEFDVKRQIHYEENVTGNNDDVKYKEHCTNGLSTSHENKKNEITEFVFSQSIDLDGEHQLRATEITMTSERVSHQIDGAGRGADIKDDVACCESAESATWNSCPMTNDNVEQDLISTEKIVIKLADISDEKLAKEHEPRDVREIEEEEKDEQKKDQEVDKKQEDQTGEDKSCKKPCDDFLVGDDNEDDCNLIAETTNDNFIPSEDLNIDHECIDDSSTEGQTALTTAIRIPSAVDVATVQRDVSERDDHVLKERLKTTTDDSISCQLNYRGSAREPDYSVNSLKPDYHVTAVDHETSQFDELVRTQSERLKMLPTGLVSLLKNIHDDIREISRRSLRTQRAFQQINDGLDNLPRLVSLIQTTFPELTFGSSSVSHTNQIGSLSVTAGTSDEPDNSKDNDNAEQQSNENTMKNNEYPVQQNRDCEEQQDHDNKNHQNHKSLEGQRHQNENHQNHNNTRNSSRVVQQNNSAEQQSNSKIEPSWNGCTTVSGRKNQFVAKTKTHEPVSPRLHDSFCSPFSATSSALSSNGELRLGSCDEGGNERSALDCMQLVTAESKEDGGGSNGEHYREVGGLVVGGGQAGKRDGDYKDEEEGALNGGGRVGAYKDERVIFGGGRISEMDTGCSGEVLDTLMIARVVRYLLAKHNIGQRVFARAVLSLSQGTVSELLSNPKPWDKLTEKGRETYRKMNRWASDGSKICQLKAASANGAAIEPSDAGLPFSVTRISEHHRREVDAGGVSIPVRKELDGLDWRTEAAMHRYRRNSSRRRKRQPEDTHLTRDVIMRIYYSELAKINEKKKNGVHPSGSKNGLKRSHEFSEHEEPRKTMCNDDRDFRAPWDNGTNRGRYMGEEGHRKMEHRISETTNGVSFNVRGDVKREDVLQCFSDKFQTHTTGNYFNNSKFERSLSESKSPNSSFSAHGYQAISDSYGSDLPEDLSTTDRSQYDDLNLKSPNRKESRSDFSSPTTPLKISTSIMSPPPAHSNISSCPLTSVAALNDSRFGLLLGNKTPTAGRGDFKLTPSSGGSRRSSNFSLSDYSDRGTSEDSSQCADNCVEPTNNTSFVSSADVTNSASNSSVHSSISSMLIPGSRNFQEFPPKMTNSEFLNSAMTPSSFSPRFVSPEHFNNGFPTRPFIGFPPQVLAGFLPPMAGYSPRMVFPGASLVPSLSALDQMMIMGMGGLGGVLQQHMNTVYGREGGGSVYGREGEGQCGGAYGREGGMHLGGAVKQSTHSSSSSSPPTVTTTHVETDATSFPSFLDTLDVATRVKDVLQTNNLGQRLFGEAVLDLSQGSVSELLSKPKPWHLLSVKGREPFVRMNLWLTDPTGVSRLLAYQSNAQKRKSNGYNNDSPIDSSAVGGGGSGGTGSGVGGSISSGGCGKKPRLFFSEEQKNDLLAAYTRDPYPSQTSIEQLAASIDVGVKTVVNWFHNHRMRAKQQQFPPLSDRPASTSAASGAGIFDSVKMEASYEAAQGSDDSYSMDVGDLGRPDNSCSAFVSYVNDVRVRNGFKLGGGIRSSCD